MTWVLPEKYEEGLLDEKGEPLSKRCGPGWGTAALLQHRMRRQQARPGSMAAQRGVMLATEGVLASLHPCSEFKRRQKLAQKEKEQAEKKVRATAARRRLPPLGPAAAAPSGSALLPCTHKLALCVFVCRPSRRRRRLPGRLPRLPRAMRQRRWRTTATRRLTPPSQWVLHWSMFSDGCAALLCSDLCS